MATKKKSLLAAAGNAGEALAIEDVFSTYLYDGAGTTNIITNGIDLAGEGGLVWTKSRSSVTDHALTDTERGTPYTIGSNITDASVANGGGLSSFNSDGYTISVGDSRVNDSGKTYVSWTFRKAPRFFDVVTYTGNGAFLQFINHNLGVTPGCIFIKRTDTSSDWVVGARRAAGGEYELKLNSDSFNFGSGSHSYSDTSFAVGGNWNLDATVPLNASGATYVAYVFAHDPLGESGDGSDGLIACGDYAGNGNLDGPQIDLGWEPQFLLVKRAAGSSGAGWLLFDTMRGWTLEADYLLRADDSIYELNYSTYSGDPDFGEPNATGFKIRSSSSAVNRNGDRYIYIAIRRGRMRQPTSGSEVFALNAYTGNVTPNFDFIGDTNVVSDLVMVSDRDATSTGWGIYGHYMMNRVLPTKTLGTATTGSEAGGWGSYFSWVAPTKKGSWGLYGSNSGTTYLNANNVDYIARRFTRAAGFFDVVAYTGDGVAGRTVSHNLGVAPEMIWVKRRDSAGEWMVYHSGMDATAPEDYYMRLSETGARSDSTIGWNDTAPTESVFSLGSHNWVNGSSNTYIAYLFASLDGVSKVGSYTGNGTSQTIDCGFTSGARFVLIKRTDSTGDWYVWDTARGIVAATDPHSSLNNFNAEVTTDDSIDPDSSGFIVIQGAPTYINVNGASYIFYAIA